MSDSQRPHGLQPTRLLHPWDFPGKSTEVGCHCLLHGPKNVITDLRDRRFKYSVGEDNVIEVMCLGNKEW